MSARDLQAFQAQSRDRTVRLAKSAMDAIEKNIRENGFYTENGGRVTIKEVCRVGGIGASTLKNATHKATRDRVRKWIVKLRKSAPTVTVDAEVIKRAGSQDLVQQIENVARNYNRFKTEYNALLENAAHAEARCLELEARLIAAEKELGFWRQRAAELEGGSQKIPDCNLILFPRPDRPPR